MLEILQFYVSSFPVWVGLTIGMGIVGEVHGKTLLYICRGFPKGKE